MHWRISIVLCVLLFFSVLLLNKYSNLVMFVIYGGGGGHCVHVYDEDKVKIS